MIRRRRLQEAAERLRTDRAADLATVAAELGYADQAHLCGDFRAVLGFTPSSYRASCRTEGSPTLAEDRHVGRRVGGER
jgi:AraC-like DNA-binding protein